MDPCNCDTENPLKRDGVSQGQRLLDALSPTFIAVDERKLEDLLVFAAGFADHLRFFDAENETSEGRNWRIFVERDVTTVIAQISRYDIQPLRDEFNSLLEDLDNAPDIDKLRALWAPCLATISLLDTWYGNCDEKFSLRKNLLLYFNSVLLPNYEKLLGMDLGAEDVLGDSEALGVSAITLNTELSEYIPETTDKIVNIFIGDNDAEKIQSASLYVKNIFEQNTNAISSIISKSGNFLKESLEEFPYHKSHTGLFIAFLRIFGYLQENMNGLTERHLEYYFNDILQIDPKAAEPDQVHVIFELAKSVSSYHELEEGTALYAGKDDNKAPILFNTDDTLVVNKAQAALFRNFHTEATSGNAALFTVAYAASQANSSDGEGGALDATQPKWNAFGDEQHSLSSPTLPEARMGFAIASSQLVLNEGDRTIRMAIQLGGDLDTTELSTLLGGDYIENVTGYFSVQLTGAKKWLSPDSTTITLYETAGVYYLGLIAVFTSGAPAISLYDSEKHAAELDIPATQPVIYLRLLQQEISDGSGMKLSSIYGLLGNATVASASITVEVSGVKDIFLQGGPSIFDPAKPFEPFGNSPGVGASLIIGSEEIFYKKVKSLSFHVDWADVPDDDFSSYYQPYTAVGLSNADRANTEFTARVEYLDKGKWVKDLFGSSTEITVSYLDETDSSGSNDDDEISSGNPVELKLFDDDAATHPQKITITGDSDLFQAERPEDAESLDGYAVNSQRGFIRLVLSGKDFLHSRYAEGLMLAAMKTVTSTTNPPTVYSIPAAYTPKLNSITLDYVSEQFLDDTDAFYTVHPFGYVAGTLSDSPDLLPKLEIDEEEDDDSTTTTSQESMFFIGLEKAEPGLSIAMLVQVVEDSGNPDLEVPDVNWSYLRDNRWIKLEQSQVLKDTTNGFVTSGIIKLALPDDATDDNTVLPSGYHWYCASVAGDAEALCKLLSVQTQAVKATFTDDGNDLTRLSVPLEAGTVKKLDTPVAQIKKLTQPYASFGGRTEENDKDYYRRVSERLRHKQRAVTMWDYERLVLEKFSSIYKTKCINHTANKLAVENCYTELAPGHVCMIVISNLRNQNQVNPLQPSTSIGTRTEIKKYLQQHCSRFVQLEVINPEYEEIQVSFGVKFLPEYDADKGYYRTKLIDDIKRFLSPWAYDEGADITFGGKIHRSFIIDFVEERDYVDYVDRFELYKTSAPDEKLEYAEAATAKSILVSAATHLLNDVEENDL